LPTKAEEQQLIISANLRLNQRQKEVGNLLLVEKSDLCGAHHTSIAPDDVFNSGFTVRRNSAMIHLQVRDRHILRCSLAGRIG